MCSIILCHSMRCTHTMIHLTMLQGAQTPTVLRQKTIHNTCSHNFTHDCISYHHAAQHSSPHASFADPPQGSLAHPPTSLPQPAFLTQWHKKFLICMGAAQPHLVELAGCLSPGHSSDVFVMVTQAHRWRCLHSYLQRLTAKTNFKQRMLDSKWHLMQRIKNHCCSQSGLPLAFLHAMAPCANMHYERVLLVTPQVRITHEHKLEFVFALRQGLQAER
jgi:hypothetical protein